MKPNHSRKTDRRTHDGIVLSVALDSHTRERLDRVAKDLKLTPEEVALRAVRCYVLSKEMRGSNLAGMDLPSIVRRDVQCRLMEIKYARAGVRTDQRLYPVPIVGSVGGTAKPGTGRRAA